MPSTEVKRIHVAVGVLVDRQGRVLVARRPSDAHQGGLWEFPGGKVERGETAIAALVREFREEVAITVVAANPLLQVSFDYPDKQVLLDVWDITEYRGQAIGLEGQPLAWRSPGQLVDSDFPEANRPIIRALGLPRELAITPAALAAETYQAYLQALSGSGIRHCLFRQKQLATRDYFQQFERFACLAKAQDIEPVFQLFAATKERLDADRLEWLREQGCAAIHSDSDSLSALQAVNPPADFFRMASSHSLDQALQASQADADLLLLSPVRPVKRYQNQRALGWEGFAEVANQVPLPVLALGGVTRPDIDLAKRWGAFGIAGISGFSGGSPAE